MKICSIQQGSEEWKELRQSKISATDIPVILGSSPFKTQLELWEQKLGLREPDEFNEKMKRGSLLEEPARQLAIKIIGKEFTPSVVVSEENPWLMASLDGLSPLHTFILEIKCMKEFSHIEAINEIIPHYYLDQIQTQLYITKAELCYFFSYRPEYTQQPYAILEVFPNPKKHAEIIAKGYEFYVKMCNMEAPQEWKLKKH